MRSAAATTDSRSRARIPPGPGGGLIALVLVLAFAVVGAPSRSAGAAPSPDVVQEGETDDVGGREVPTPRDPSPRSGLQGEAAGFGRRGAFGFELKEERRYVLGPDEALRPGESASWTIRLDRLEGDVDDQGGARRAVFVLEHVRDEYLSNLFGDQSRVLRVLVEAELTVNPYGFPLRLVLREQQDMGGDNGSQSELRTTTYELEGDHYLKSVRVGGRQWSFDVPIASQEHLDVGSRVGLYLFLPSGLRCLGDPADAGRGPRRRGTTGEFRSCGGMEPAFANPGLLSLVMPDIWEDDDGDREVLFFRPLGVGTVPYGLMNVRSWLRNERDSLASLRRYYDHNRVKLEEVASVEVGSRTFEAWRLSISGTVRDVWVDHQGRVLRSDIDPHRRTGRNRFLRLQFPSEY